VLEDRVEELKNKVEKFAAENKELKQN